MTTAPDSIPGSITVRELAERYIAVRMIDAKPVTVGNFRRAIKRLNLHYHRDVAVSELTDQLIAEHLHWLLNHQKLRPAGINSSHRAYLLSLWRYAVDCGLLDNLPRVRKLKELRHVPDSWTTAELRQLIDATSIFTGRMWPAPVPLDAFWRALILVAYWTALRVGTLLQIRQQDMDADSGWLYVQPEASKNRQGKRCRLGADAVDAVRAIQYPRRDLLFPWPYCRETLFFHFRQLQRAAGLAESQLANQRFHKIRRTAATLAAVNAGMPAAIALLDHSGPEVTKRYLDPTKLPGCDATQFLPPIG